MLNDQETITQALHAWWFICNLGTGILYFHIPYEMWRGLRGLGLHGIGHVLTVAGAFIAGCGSHHISMVRFHHHLDWIQLSTDTVMFFASLFMSALLVSSRSKMRGLLRHLAGTHP